MTRSGIGSLALRAYGQAGSATRHVTEAAFRCAGCGSLWSQACVARNGGRCLLCRTDALAADGEVEVGYAPRAGVATISPAARRIVSLSRPIVDLRA